MYCGDGVSITSVSLRDFSKELSKFSEKKKNDKGKVKCYFDVSGRPSKPSECPGEWDWEAMDSLVSDLISSVDPGQLLCANNWGAFLYVAFANLICNDGLAATILPDKLLGDGSYIQARNSFLRTSLIKSVVYLGWVDSEDDKLALLLTSNKPSSEPIRCLRPGEALRSVYRNERREGWRYADVQKTYVKRASDLADRFLHKSLKWEEEDARNYGYCRNSFFELNETLVLQNEVRLDSSTSRFYQYSRGYDARLRNEAEKVPSYSAPATHRRYMRNSGSSPANNGHVSDSQEKKGEVYEYYLGIPGTKTASEKKVPADHYLRAGDILISRVTRMYSSVGVEIVDESVLDGRKHLCPTSYICIRPKANDLLYSLALFNYLSTGHGRDALSGVADMRSSLTWDALSKLELPAELVSESDEWRKLKEKITDTANGYLSARKELAAAKKNEDSLKKQLARELSSAIK